MRVKDSYLVGDLDDKGHVINEDKPMPFLDSIQKACFKSIEKDNPISISQLNTVEEDMEIDYLVVGGRIFKQVCPTDILP